MEFYFDVKCNHDMPYINTVTLLLKDGQLITLDRHSTIFQKTDRGNVCNMTWNEPYEWSGERELPLPAPKEFVGAKLVDYDVEDDAPEDYEFVVTSCKLYSDEKDVQIKIDLNPLIDLAEKKRIRMYLLDDEEENYERFFTNKITPSTPILSQYVFDTPKEFMKTWRKLADDPTTMWYWVYDGNNVVCSGAIDPGDEEIYAESWEGEL